MNENNAASFDPSDEIFARMAESYDTLCDLFSLFAHRYWKSQLVKRVLKVPGHIVVDAAAGTGDIGIRLAEAYQREAKGSQTVILGDLCQKMLTVAERKALKKGVLCEYQLLDAQTFESIPDNSVDILSISFAMKICDRDQVLQASRRILKPGGHFFCLEASRIQNPWLQGAYLTYMKLCVPLMAMLVTKGDRSAYNYLLKGVQTFPDKETFAEEIRASGFTNVDATSLTLGIVSLHAAMKPV